MRIRFPNPYGYARISEARAKELQACYGFSDAYRKFLVTQNGLLLDALECANGDYLARDDAHAQGCSDLRVLYGLDSDDEEYELEDHLDDAEIFGGCFFPIGEGYGGNTYVEVLRGSRRGWIASLDRGMYVSCEDLQSFVEEMELEGFDEASPDERADLLTDPEFGLAWFHATSMTEFVERCVHCDTHLRGFVRDALSMADA